ncbi:hypothetical protein C0989_006991, partial [Termitomyces sp. Mn162]
MVLIQINPKDNIAPKDPSAAGSLALCNCLNKLLECIDSEANASHQAEDGEVELVIPKTRTIGLKMLGD